MEEERKELEAWAWRGTMEQRIIRRKNDVRRL